VHVIEVCPQDTLTFFVLMATTFKTLPDGTYTKRENKIKVLLQRHIMK
jgi:hypothetical protein